MSELHLAELLVLALSAETQPSRELRCGVAIAPFLIEFPAVAPL